MDNKDLNKARFYMFIATVLILSFGIFMSLLLSGCTLSMQNISTKGFASDLVDETQEASPNVHPDIAIPLPTML